MLDHLRDPAEIYRRSFAIIRAEADLARFSADLEPVAVRLIHACGMIDIAADLTCSEDVAVAARRALQSGAPILCDARMVSEGIIRARLPASNAVLCGLESDDMPPRATSTATTRSAVAMERLLPHFAGALIAIGNAPTALFRVLELLDGGAPRPAAILGFPVGFVGAVEAKAALAADSRSVPYLTLLGRRGGSAMAAAAVNALASAREAS